MTRHAIPASIVATAILLSACGTPSAPLPTITGTLNGSRAIDASTFQFGFTPLSTGVITETAQLKDVSISKLSKGRATVKMCNTTGLRVQASMTTAISIDSTGSMSWTDPKENRRDAAKSYVHRMNKNDIGAVLSFDSTTTPTDGMRSSYLWQDFTGNRGLLTAGVEHATFLGGNTPMYDAALDALELLSKSTDINRSLLLLTDGEDNSSTSIPDDVIHFANDNNIEVYVVGLNDSQTMDFSRAEEIASATGGLFQEATSSDQLEKYFDNVYNALHSQGCLQLQFSSKPSAGTVVTGKLNVTVSDAGKPDTVVSTPFSVKMR